MEKQTIKLLTIAITSALLAVSSTYAGTDFRLSSKSIIPRSPVKAQPFNGYVFGYGGVSFGSSWLNTGAFDSYEFCGCTAPTFDPYNVPMEWDTETGHTIGGGIGKYSGLWGGSRFELEYSYLSNQVDRLQWAGFDMPADFTLETKALMVNYLKEVPLGCATGYFGGGLGYAWTSMHGTTGTVEYNDRDGGFAWQFIAGIDVPITERLTFFTQYRYMMLANQSYTTDFGDFHTVTREKPSNHSVLFGARVSF